MITQREDGTYTAAAQIKRSLITPPFIAFVFRSDFARGDFTHCSATRSTLTFHTQCNYRPSITLCNTVTPSTSLALTGSAQASAVEDRIEIIQKVPTSSRLQLSCPYPSLIDRHKQHHELRQIFNQWMMLIRRCLAAFRQGFSSDSVATIITMLLDILYLIMSGNGRLE